MNDKISKAQLEVWEWKDALYNEVKRMKLKDGIKYLLEKALRIRKDLEKNNKLKIKRSRKITK